MPRFPTAQKRPDTIPSFLVIARSFYGEAFGPRRPNDLAESMADWSELTEEERSFALAHLQYLNLVAQAGTQRVLGRVADLLEELVEYAEDAAVVGDADAAVDAEVEAPGEDGLPDDDDFKELADDLPDVDGLDHEDDLDHNDDVVDAVYEHDGDVEGDDDVEEVPDGEE